MFKGIKRCLPRGGAYLSIILLMSAPLHASIKEACELRKAGRYRESMLISHGLKLKNLSYFDRGRNYFSMAVIYAEYGCTNKAEFYFEKAASRKNQYYWYVYAKYKEEQGDFYKSKELYEKALNAGGRDYIKRAYNRMIQNAAIQDEYFMEFLDDSVKSKIIKNAIIIR